MGVGRLESIAAVALLAGIALPLSTVGAETPQHKFEINTLTCEKFAAVERPEVRERLLVYMNGYFDGMRKATTWEADVVGKRIDEVLRVCAANPNSTLFSVFQRAWTR